MPAGFARVLVLDDDADTARLMRELLAQTGRTVEASADPDAALARHRVQPFDVVVTDLNLGPDHDGIDVLRAVRAAHAPTQVVIVTAFGELQKAVEAVREGAFDFLSKPFHPSEFRRTVDRALEHAVPAPPPDDEQALALVPALLGRSPAMTAVYKQIAYAAASDAPVLVVGESGTGKELVARAIHAHSRRAGRPFLPINCGALTETLLESELFGHQRGAFTGATSETKGIFQSAHTGTVFLDEVGEMSPGLQVKVLRVLQEGEVRPVGAQRPVHVDVRIVAATNVNVDQAVQDGRFRQDLYYRLGVVIIHLPPLRERRDDIPLLVERFLRMARAKTGKSSTMSDAALAALVAYEWPGNVRELENTVERLVVFSRDGRIEPADLPQVIAHPTPGTSPPLFADLPTLDELERRYLLHVLERVGGNRSRAAEMLGIDRRTLYRMAERFGIALGGAA